MYIGRPVPLGNVMAGSMPIARYSVDEHLRHGVAAVLRAFAAGRAGADRLAHPQAAAGDQAPT